MHEVFFRVADKDSAEYVNARLRRADRREVAALGTVVDGAVFGSVRQSEYAWTGFLDGEPAMVFGLDRATLSEEATVWALGTDKCTAAPREMFVFGRKVVAELLEICPALTNFCHAENTLALRWLKRLGFDISEPQSVGVNGEKFCRIMIRKRRDLSCVCSRVLPLPGQD